MIISVCHLQILSFRSRLCGSPPDGTDCELSRILEADKMFEELIDEIRNYLESIDVAE